ncbi:hypothetical protein EVAR_52784_1 [Eumeta japonica]|uniref:Uncharacterized protein n=1 Tax=Eumeta variegata TaxID=151549 RepID=A0A4C1Z5T7_EUMVA|nr:hypothetical protein EVAR_52784_1 [Eumeta japonica]
MATKKQLWFTGKKNFGLGSEDILSNLEHGPIGNRDLDLNQIERLVPCLSEHVELRPWKFVIGETDEGMLSDGFQFYALDTLESDFGPATATSSQFRLLDLRLITGRSLLRGFAGGGIVSPSSRSGRARFQPLENPSRKMCASDRRGQFFALFHLSASGAGVFFVRFSPSSLTPPSGNKINSFIRFVNQLTIRFDPDSASDSDLVHAIGFDPGRSLDVTTGPVSCIDSVRFADSQNYVCVLEERRTT